MDRMRTLLSMFMLSIVSSCMTTPNDCRMKCNREHDRLYPANIRLNDARWSWNLRWDLTVHCECGN